MKTDLACFPCYLRQAVQVARVAGGDVAMQHRAMLAVAAVLPELPLVLSPPANAVAVYRAIAAVTGVTDPYAEKKSASNAAALAVIAALREEIRRAPQPLLAALRFAIAGNIIDYGAAERFDVSTALRRCRQLPLACDHSERLVQCLATLPPGASVLYLADNCGEIVYDSLLIELLAEQQLAVTVVVKKLPIINDATRPDAEQAGIERWAEIIDNGTGCPGSPLESCSAAFIQRFMGAELVIAKGQGNFESLSECGREVFFLLTVKCPVVGRHLAELTALPEETYPGHGEMVVYHYQSQPMEEVCSNE